jgi:FixJ family two-component response regulator
MPHLRVAIVDDDMSVRRGLARLLRSAGLEVVSFASATEFLSDSFALESACAILDIHLIGMSGLDLLAHLRASGSDLPVIIITAHDDPRSREESERLGCAAFVCKPFEASVLLGAVRAALARGGDDFAGVERLHNKT